MKIATNRRTAMAHLVEQPGDAPICGMADAQSLEVSGLQWSEHEKRCGRCDTLAESRGGIEALLREPEAAKDLVAATTLNGDRPHLTVYERQVTVYTMTEEPQELMGVIGELSEAKESGRIAAFKVDEPTKRDVLL